MRNFFKECWKVAIIMLIYWTVTIMLSINKFFSYRNIKLIILIEIILIAACAFVDYFGLDVDVLFWSTRKQVFVLVTFFIGVVADFIYCNANIESMGIGIVFMLGIPTISGTIISKIINSLRR